MLIAATLATHSPAMRAGYIWDDNTALHDNPMIAAANGLYRFWFTTEPADYWPLSATTLWLEWRIWGDNPTPYHVTNIVIHALAAVALWRVLLRLHMGSLAAFLGGLLFAVHPVTVASTAWIAERKNVLSMLLYLLAILAYLRFEDEGRRRWYILALLAGAGALLAKTSVVALPVILLLLAWWRHHVVSQRTIIRTLPFFLMSLVLGLITIYFQHNNAISGVVVRAEPFFSRLAAVGWVVWFYLYKLLLPIDLAMVYPRWSIEGTNPAAYGPLILLLVCFFVLWKYRRSWGRGPLVALSAFVIVLAPVLGLIAMAYARYSLVADHLHYPGMPGMMALIAAGLAAAWSRSSRSNQRLPVWGTALAIGLIYLTLAVLTWRQCHVYKDSESLWTHTIKVNDRAWVAYYNRGVVYGQHNLRNRAIQDYTKAIEIKPDYAEAHNNLGVIYGEMGEFDREILHCTQAASFKPRYADAFNNRGHAYCGQGAYDLAIEDYTKALEYKPNDAGIYYNRGVARSGKGDYEEAIRDFTVSIQLRPSFAGAFNNRGIAHAARGAHHLAIQDYNQALQLQPRDVDVYVNRSITYRSMNDIARAIEDCNRAIELKPAHAEAYNNRANAYGQMGDLQAALRDYAKAIELKPTCTEAYNNRAAAFFFLKQYDQAWADIEQCQRHGGVPHPQFLKDLANASGRTE